MTLRSMTGFAREAGDTGPYRWAWEIKTVNGRGLDLRLRLPPGHEALGEMARQLIGKALGRGTCHASLSLARAEQTPVTRINTALLNGLIDSLRGITLPAGIASATLDGLLSVRGVVEIIDDADDEALLARLAADVEAGLSRALEALVAARTAEGEALAAVLSAQIDRIAELAAAAEACPARQPEAIKARLAAQVAALLDSDRRLDETRLYQEAVLIAAKADIREELDRIKSHVESVRALLAEGGVIGRRLDFLAQELSREANTLCAKAGDASLTAIGLDLKTVVEQFREQVQNVE